MVKLPHWPIPFEKAEILLGLERVRSLLKEIGNPHLKIPPTIHVAGTNGKGSTIALMRSIFEAAGYKVHVYTSPHLIRFNERIRVAGEEIDDDFLYENTEECRIAADKIGLKLTFFEGTTAIAFSAFAKIPADIVLIETGMGGRLDATNVIDNPLLTVITSISRDHMEFLGKELTQITAEKAGIIKKGSSCVVSQQYPEVFKVLEYKANELNVPLIAFEYDWIVEKTAWGMIYKSSQGDFEFPPPNLIGDHQYINAGNAITAVLNAKGFNISAQDIARGLQKVYWPARLQKLIEGPIVEMASPCWEIWVDGAHNQGGAYILANWLKEQDDKPCYMIFGTTKGRDCQEFLAYFKNIVVKIMAVPIDAEPLSYGAEHIVHAAEAVGINSVMCSSAQDAIDKIKVIEEKNKIRILICGSLYLAGDILYKNQKLRSGIS